MKKKRTNPYKEANEAFLAEKAKEEGVVVLDNGVMYRKLEEGHGTRKPTPWTRYVTASTWSGRRWTGCWPARAMPIRNKTTA